MITAADLCIKMEGELRGDPSRTVEAVRPPESAGPQDLAYVADDRPIPEDLRAGVLLVGTNRDDVEVPDSITQIRHPNSRLAFARAIEAVYESGPPPFTGVDRTAVIDGSAKIAADVAIGPRAVIGPRVLIGKGSRIGAGTVLTSDIAIGDESVIDPNVTIYPNSILGRGVRVLSGAVIGSDGFGFVPTPKGPVRVPHVGGVRIGDFAEIGANSTIDRGVLDNTEIGAYVKLDNLVHIAHNCTLGPGTLLAAQVGIAGSTKIGSGVIFGGQSGAAGHLQIGDGVRVGAKTGVLSSVDDGQEVLGFPAAPASQVRRQYVAVSQLPEFRRKINDLLQRLNTLLPEEESR